MSFWTEDRERKLALMVAGGFSASQIAEKIGAPTRNAVIGKVHRLGLRCGGGAASNPKLRTPKPPPQPAVRRFSPKPTPIFVPDPAPGHTPNPATLTDRGAGCAFPISGAGADTLFCAGHTDGKRYCAKHRAVMYEAPKPASVQRRSEEASLWAAGR